MRNLGLTLCTSSSSPSVSSHWDGLLHFGNIGQVFQRTFHLPAIDRLSSFTGILEADAQVRASTAGGFTVLDLLGSVSDLEAM